MDLDADFHDASLEEKRQLSDHAESEQTLVDEGTTTKKLLLFTGPFFGYVTSS
jgi:hypothetical protein